MLSDKACGSSLLVNMAEFHRFTLLPRELRDQIWDHALRHNTPGVHFFSTHAPSRIDPAAVEDSMVVKPFEYQGRPAATPHRGILTLSAPRHRCDGERSWSSRNDSTYMVDSGMWTACRESRDRMLRHFKPQETSHYATFTHKEIRRLFTLTRKTSTTMKIQRDNGETQYITVNPSKDLVCFQPLKPLVPSSLNMLMAFFGSTSSRDFFSPFIFKDSNNTSYKALQNIAVEFQPSWALHDDRGRISFHLVLKSLFHWRVTEPRMDGLQTFWIIDYSLSRDAKSKEPGARVFRSGNCVFTEAEVGRHGFNEDPDRYTPLDVYDDDYSNWDEEVLKSPYSMFDDKPSAYKLMSLNAITLVQELNNRIRCYNSGGLWYQRHVRWDSESSYHSSRDDELNARFFRVLVCEDLEEWKQHNQTVVEPSEQDGTHDAEYDEEYAA